MLWESEEQGPLPLCLWRKRLRRQLQEKQLCRLQPNTISAPSCPSCHPGLHTQPQGPLSCSAHGLNRGLMSLFQQHSLPQNSNPIITTSWCPASWAASHHHWYAPPGPIATAVWEALNLPGYLQHCHPMKWPISSSCSCSCRQHPGW